jgi:hypothetical protein
VRKPASDYQRVVVKASYQNLYDVGGRGRAVAHLHYLGRGGQTPAHDDGHGVADERFFGASGPRDKDAFAEGLETRQFRFIVSPEAGDQLDLRAFTRDLMEAMERDLRCGLDWIAIDHYGTDKPHVHIVLNGVDASGRELRIDRDYLSRGMRYRASHLATLELGLRRVEPAKVRAQNMAEDDRFNAIDRVLEAAATPVGASDADHVALRLDMRRPSYFARQAAHAVSYAARRFGTDTHPALAPDDMFDRSTQLKRLAHLAEYGLAEEVERGVWHIDAHWKPALARLRRQAELTHHFELNGLQVTAAAFDPLPPGERFTGEVIDVGLADEHHGRFFVLLAHADGRHYWADLGKIDAAEIPALGEQVTVERTPRRLIRPRKSHRNIARCADEGHYSLDAHMQWASEHLSLSESELDDYLEAHENALIELCEHGLAEYLADGHWQVVDALESRIEELNHSSTPEGWLPSQQWRPYAVERHGRIWDQVRADESVPLDDVLRDRTLRGRRFAEAVLDPYEKALRARARRLASFGLADFDEATGRVDVVDADVMAQELPVRGHVACAHGERRRVAVGVEPSATLVGEVVERVRIAGTRYLIVNTHDGRITCVRDYLKADVVEPGGLVCITSSSSGFVDVTPLDARAYQRRGLTPLDKFLTGELELVAGPSALRRAVAKRRAFLRERGLLGTASGRPPEAYYADLLAMEKGCVAARQTVFRPDQPCDVLGTLVGRLRASDGMRLAVIDGHDGRRYLVDDYSRKGTLDEGDFVQLRISPVPGRDPYTQLSRHELNHAELHDATSLNPLDRYLVEADLDTLVGPVGNLLAQRAGVLSRAGLECPKDVGRDAWLAFRAGQLGVGDDVDVTLCPESSIWTAGQLRGRIRGVDGGRYLVVDTLEDTRCVVPDFGSADEIAAGTFVELSVVTRQGRRPFYNVVPLAADARDRTRNLHPLDVHAHSAGDGVLVGELRALLRRRRERSGWLASLAEDATVSRSALWLERQSARMDADRPADRFVSNPSADLSGLCQVVGRLRCPDGERYCFLESPKGTRVAVRDFAGRDELSSGDLAHLEIDDGFVSLRPLSDDERSIDARRPTAVDRLLFEGGRSGSLAPKLSERLERRAAFLASLGVRLPSQSERDDTSLDAFYAAIVARACCSDHTFAHVVLPADLAIDRVRITGTVAAQITLPDGRQWCAISTTHRALVCLPVGNDDPLAVGSSIVARVNRTASSDLSIEWSSPSRSQRQPHVPHTHER